MSAVTADAPVADGLEAAVEAAFSRDGALARIDARYAERAAQQRMAAGVARAIERRSALVVEAGTGVGKTFAYLVPTLLAGARALVSTATKSLQDQLYLRDLPRLVEALEVPATLALLKGRGSYLCLHRLKGARQDGDLAPTAADGRTLRMLARVERWASGTTSGDLAEIDGLDERSPVIPIVTSTRDNCLGTDCPELRDCYVMKARRDALAADVVVVNHHLFFADLALRDTGVAELLPSVEIAVFDEAHQLAEAGVQFLGRTLGSAQLMDFARDALACGLRLARGLQSWPPIVEACERAARELRLAAVGPLHDVRASIKLRWEERAAQPDFTAALASVQAAWAAAEQAFAAVAESAPDLERLRERAAALAAGAARFAVPPAPGLVRWIDLGPHHARLVESPLDIRDALRAQRERAPKAWVFTSATLGDDERLSWFTEPAGLEDADMLRVGSPFDYAAHARLYVPAGFPKPNAPDHAEAVAVLASRCARALGGRTFVLTTTLRALHAVGTQLKVEFDDAGDDIAVLVQGSAPKRRLLGQFLERPASVLVGSQSFWEGIDVPGEALQCVLIDKLPFPPPNDPLVEARVRRLEAEGRNAFVDFFVAEAAVSLKQGAGRLIRSETDRGLLVVCDPRLAGGAYGKRLRAALPPMTPVASQAEALAWLASLRGETPAGGTEWAEAPSEGR